MRKNKRTKNKFFYILCLLIIFSFLLIWWIVGTQAVNPNSKDLISFYVESGSGAKKISNQLKERNLIRDKLIFLTVLKLMRIDNSIQAGKFELSSSMNVFTIATKLTKSSTDVRITFPEGKRSEEIAEILVNHLSNLDSESITSDLKTYQGFLFPDTYNFEKDATIESIIDTMKSNFDNKYSTLKISQNFTQQEIVNIAAMIEREAKHPKDRKIVASVIYNRLNIGMKLDIDATVQYALGYNQSQRSWWKKGLTLQDLTINSPYNTYTNAGLPPQPIANPGLASLEAAADPAVTNYLYYFTDKNGINHYARTLEEQNANINKYGL